LVPIRDNGSIRSSTSPQGIGWFGRYIQCPAWSDTHILQAAA
jgi:hypothetical protein